MAKPKQQPRETFWTRMRVAWLRQFFRNNSTRWCANMLGCSVDRCKKKASRMGLKKTKAYMRALGRA